MTQVQICLEEVILTKRSYRARRGQVTEATQTPMTTLKELKASAVEMGETLYTTTVHARSPCNLTELEQVCQEIWSKTAVSRCARFIDPHTPSAVTVDGGASSKYWLEGSDYFMSILV